MASEFAKRIALVVLTTDADQPSSEVAVDAKLQEVAGSAQRDEQAPITRWLLLVQIVPADVGPHGRLSTFSRPNGETGDQVMPLKDEQLRTDSPQAQKNESDWPMLAQYSLLLLGVGVMTGYFLTLCPTTQPRRSWAPIVMYASYAVLWLFVIACFAGIIERLKGANSSHE